MKYKSYCALLLFFTLSASGNDTNSIGYCDPYFVSTSKSQVNMRNGPGEEYKIQYVYMQKGLPLIVIAKCNDWRKIRDPDGEEGWIRKSLLSVKRFVIFKNEANIYEKPQDNSLLKAVVKRNVVAKLMAVRGKWCKIEHESGISGWTQKSLTFGTIDCENW